MVETGGQRVGPGRDFSGAQRHLEEHREMVRMESRAMGWGWLTQALQRPCIGSLDLTSGQHKAVEGK